MWKRHIAFVVVLLLASITAHYPAQANPYIVLGIPAQAYPPYHMSEGSNPPGIFKDIMFAVVEEAGLNYQTQYFEQLYLRRAFINNDYQLNCCVSKAWRSWPQEQDIQHFSQAVLVHRDVWVFPTDKGFDVTEDLVGRQLALIRGFSYRGITTSLIDRHDFETVDDILAAIDSQRFDGTIVSEYVLRWKMRERNLNLEMGPVQDETLLHLHVHDSIATLLPILNMAIQSLHQDGRIRDIVVSYLGANARYEVPLQ